MDVKAVTVTQVKARAFIVGVRKDRTAPSLKAFGLADDATLKAMLANQVISFGFKTVRSVPTPQGLAILVGLGDAKALTQEKVGTLTNLACRAAAGLGVDVAATSLIVDAGLDAGLAAQAVASGALIGELDFDQYKSKKPEIDAKTGNAKPIKPTPRLTTLQVVLPAGAAAKKAKASLERAAIIARAVNDSRLLSNTPANICTPAYLADAAKARAKEGGYTLDVKTRAQLLKEGFGALCGVAQGSVNEERLITMDYHPKGAKKTLVVIGKGVCFDSGGISLKPGDKMWEMKYDKVGACNTIAMMAIMNALKVKHRVVGIVPAVENMPSATAQRPGDIVTSKDGTTIEVLNTDAEGRLILADAMAHAQQFKPTWMATMATLTGACEIAVGPTYVAVMSKNDKLAKAFVTSAQTAGDKAWQLPQGEEFDEANKGAYADLQNISLTVRAGTSIGGSFLSFFAKDTPFVHLDIASKAWTPGLDYFGKGPTGAGLRIVLQRILEE